MSKVNKSISIKKTIIKNIVDNNDISTKVVEQRNERQ